MARKTTAGKKAATKKSTTTTRSAAPAEGWRDFELFDNAKITVKVESNPYRGKRAERFVYETGMTVAQAVEKGARRPDIKWDSAKGYIALSGGSKGSATKPAAADAGKGSDGKHHSEAKASSTTAAGHLRRAA